VSISRRRRLRHGVVVGLLDRPELSSVALHVYGDDGVGVLQIYCYIVLLGMLPLFYLTERVHSIFLRVPE
jgi:hypothetical protein